MRCPNCQAIIKPGARFCGSCGYALDQLPTCPRCHAPIAPNHHFCARCGYDLQSNVAVPQETKPQEIVAEPPPSPSVELEKPKRKGRKSRWIALGAGTMILVLFSAIAYWLLTQPISNDLTAAVPPPTDAPVSSPALTPTTITGAADEVWERAEKAISNGDMPEGIALLRQLHGDYPDYKPEQVASRLGELCANWYDVSVEQADPDLMIALDCLAEIGVEPPDGSDVASWWEDFFRAREHLTAGEADDAMAVLESLVDQVPADFANGRHKSLLYEAYLQKGDALCGRAKVDAEFTAAREWYLKARSLEPPRLDAVERLQICQPPTSTPTVTPTPTLTPTPLPPGAMKAIFEQDGRFNVRSGPGYNYPIVDIVEATTVFTVTGRTSDAQWLHAVDEQQRDVWVYAPLLETNYPPEAAPIAQTTPVPPNNYLVADSIADFRTKQGYNRWYYLASKNPNSLEFDWMSPDGNMFRWMKGGRNPEMHISAEESYPSWNSDAIRLWSNFYEGLLRIEGEARKEPGAGHGGNGVDLRIVQRRTDAKTGEDILIKVLWQGSLEPYDTNGFTFYVDPVEVKQRDVIYFITSARGDDTLDNTIFTMRIFLMNSEGIEITSTPDPPPTPTTSIQPESRTCFEPKLRHYERSHGGFGEAVGYVYKNDGQLSGVRILVEGAPGPDQWRHEFPVSGDGGYELTALTVYGPPFYYTMRVTGPNIRSETFKLEYPEGPRRAVVDWYQTPCQ